VVPATSRKRIMIYSSIAPHSLSLQVLCMEWLCSKITLVTCTGFKSGMSKYFIQFLEMLPTICLPHSFRHLHRTNRLSSTPNLVGLSSLTSPNSAVSISTAQRRPCRTFSTSRPRHEFHFDTHHFVQRLEQDGLNRAQAEGIMNAMAEVIDESIRNMTSNMVTKAEQEKVGCLGQ